jgi:hypothetical protein
MDETNKASLVSHKQYKWHWVLLLPHESLTNINIACFVLPSNFDSRTMAYHQSAGDETLITNTLENFTIFTNLFKH